MTDEEQFQRLRDGDSAAFEEIFRRSYAALVGSAERIVRSRAQAEEIVQDVMLELWRRRETLAPHGSPQAYLFQSVRNRALNEVRHQRVERRSEPHLSLELARHANADSGVVEEEIEAALHDAIVSLPPKCRQVFEMSRVRGLRYAEIAQIMGVSVKAVEAHMGRALRTMRERLAPWLPDGEAL